MVQGLKAKNRRSGSVQIDYLIHVQEIKPWPPSQSLRSLRSVLIQWENGDRHSGSTNLVVPTLGSAVGEGKIEFNESFRLPVTLVRDMTVKGGGADAFQKNCIEFNLYEPRRDKTARGQSLASANIDLADYGVVREALCITAPMICKRSFKNTDQPVLFINIQPFDKRGTSSSLNDTLSRGMSLDSNGGESISALINGEYAEENEATSFTDDDVSSHSSLTVSSSTFESTRGLPPKTDENGPGRMTHSSEGDRKEYALVSKFVPDKLLLMHENGMNKNLKASKSFFSSIDLTSDPGSPVNGYASIAGSPDSGSMSIQKDQLSDDLHSSSLLLDEKPEDDLHASVKSEDLEKLGEDVREMNDFGIDYQQGTATSPNIYNISMKEKGGKIKYESGEERHNMEEKNLSGDEEVFDAQDATGKLVLRGSNVLYSGREHLVMKNNILRAEGIKNLKSVRSPLESGKSSGLISNQLSETKLRSYERKDAKTYPKDTRSVILDGKVQQLQHKIKMLEGELREAAAIEAALYSVVAEHGSSMSKVHAPARRLARLYLHSCRETSQSRRASAARTAVSGLVLIAKACGNDVPRLTFWLSNSIVLRTILSQATGDLDLRFFAGPQGERNGGNEESNAISSSLKWKASSPTKKVTINVTCESFVDWEDPQTFTSALEKVEAWIFSRIIESIWWQTLTPHMQSTAARDIEKVSSPGSLKSYRRVPSSIDQEQGYFSLDLWKKAFKDGYERICPVRAGGHECGCLPMLARLIMEQSVARLDVAMFNAILRESADDIPTDPVSDPISDSRVLPVPAGKSSFGAGAQLKNAIGNWSRWLTDLFGMDDDELGDEDNDDDRQDACFKSFHLLNALSDLMMLPKDLLLSRSVREEVCPTFGPLLIKRILHHFVPDEFCPDRIPNVILEALSSEDPLEAGEQFINNFPCTAAPIVYLPPSAASITGIIGEIGSPSELRRSGSSLYRKSYTSDDELDDLNSPLASILTDGSRSSPTSTKPSLISKENSHQNAIRYELLRRVWTE